MKHETWNDINELVLFEPILFEDGDDDVAATATGGGSLCWRMRGKVPSRDIVVGRLLAAIDIDIAGDEFDSDCVALVLAVALLCAAANARDRSAAITNNDCVLLSVK